MILSNASNSSVHVGCHVMLTTDFSGVTLINETNTYTKTEHSFHNPNERQSILSICNYSDLRISSIDIWDYSNNTGYWSRKWSEIIQSFIEI